MEYQKHQHRHGWDLLQLTAYKPLWTEIHQVITGISDHDIQSKVQNWELGGKRGRSAYWTGGKSLSRALNELFKERFVALGWASESPIFKSEPGSPFPWRLDFAKSSISVEVVFNNSGSTAWNMLKPVLAGEINHVEKAVDTKFGVLILATEEMKKAGGFDAACETFENARSFLKPLQNQLSVPLVLIGLEAPESFSVEEVPGPGRKSGRFVSPPPRLSPPP